MNLGSLTVAQWKKARRAAREKAAKKKQRAARKGAAARKGRVVVTDGATGEIIGKKDDDAVEGKEDEVRVSFTTRIKISSSSCVGCHIFG